MRGAEKLEMEIEIPAARGTKHRVILILRVLLILVFITVVTLMSFLFIYCRMEQNIEGRLSNLSLGMDSRVERLSQDDYRTLKKLTAIETSIGDLKDSKGQMEQNIEGRLSNLSLGMDSRVECLSQDDNRTLEKLTAIKTSIGDLKGSKMMEKLSTMETSMKALTGQRLEDMQQNMDVKLRNLSMGVQSLESMLSQDDSQVMKKLFALETSVKELNGLPSKNVPTVVGAVGKQTEEIQKMKTSFSSDIQRISGFLGKVAEGLQKSSSNPLCSEGWRHGLRCYYLSSDSIPWIDSKKDCEDKEAHLVVINSEEEMNFLRGIANKQTFWIGLTEVDGTWRWVDGTPYDITPKFWEKGQPDDWKDHNYKRGEKGEDCATLRIGIEWNDLHCSEKVKYICEKKMTF